MQICCRKNANLLQKKFAAKKCKFTAEKMFSAINLLFVDADATVERSIKQAVEINSQQGQACWAKRQLSRKATNKFSDRTFDWLNQFP
jgi:hypothetical protein